MSCSIIEVVLDLVFSSIIFICFNEQQLRIILDPGRYCAESIYFCLVTGREARRRIRPQAKLFFFNLLAPHDKIPHAKAWLHQPSQNIMIYVYPFWRGTPDHGVVSHPSRSGTASMGLFKEQNIRMANFSWHVSCLTWLKTGKKNFTLVDSSLKC